MARSVLSDIASVARQSRSGRTNASSIWASSQLWIAASVTLLIITICIAPNAQALTSQIERSTGSFLSEPDIAINPTNPQNLIVVSKDIATDGRQALDAFYSFDGGASFEGGPLVDGSYMGVDADASDPVIEFNRTGAAYFGQLAWLYPGGNAFDSVIGSQRTDDGGVSYGDPVATVRTTNSERPMDFGSPTSQSMVHDKEWLAIDRTGGAYDGSIYAAWVRIKMTRDNRQLNRIVFSRSVDGGATFSQPKRVSSIRRFALGPQLVVQPDGDIHLLWASYKKSELESRGQIRHVSSEDGGRTFSWPQHTITSFPSGIAAYNLVAVAGSGSGRLLACWSQGKMQRSSRTYCTRSYDGSVWRKPRPVALGVSGRHDLVAVAAQGTRRFWVSFYATKKGETSVRLYRSDNGGRSFRLAKVLAKRNYGLDTFVGDYTGLESTGNRIFAAYVLPRRELSTPNVIYVKSLPTSAAP